MKRPICLLLVVMACYGALVSFRSKSDSEQITIKLQQAQLNMSDQKYDEALTSLKEIVKEYPYNPKTEIALATINHCYQIIGRMNEAFTYFQEVEKANKSKGIGIVAVYMYIPILIDREHYDEALAKCQFLCDQLSDDSYWAIGAIFTMANIYCEKINDREKGITLYEKIIKRYPTSQFATIAKMELEMNKK
jgi:tetratricopeptide (TPR) repeat protein